MRGPLRDILLCHCEECRRWGGYVGAFTAPRAEDLALVEERGLRWAASPRSDRNARRGFCGECGCRGEACLALQAERTSGRRKRRPYDELPEDELPRDVEASEIRWS